MKDKTIDRITERMGLLQVQIDGVIAQCSVLNPRSFSELKKRASELSRHFQGWRKDHGALRSFPEGKEHLQSVDSGLVDRVSDCCDNLMEKIKEAQKLPEGAGDSALGSALENVRKTEDEVANFRDRAARSTLSDILSSNVDPDFPVIDVDRENG